jgi:streptogramin lyase
MRLTHIDPKLILSRMRETRKHPRLTSALVTVLLSAMPLFAQLPPGTSRMTVVNQLTDAAHITATADGTLWVGAYLDNEIGRVRGGDATHVAIPFWTGTLGQVLGADDAVWAATAGVIARIDPNTSAVERFPYGNSRPVQFLAGPDGNLWVVKDTVPFSVARMATDGTILSTYPAGTARPTGAAFGSDGALYLAIPGPPFSPNTPGKLIRLTASGELTEFPSSHRLQLFAAPGFLWSGATRTAPGLGPGGEILKISYTGETLLSLRIDMFPIASDTEGNLWLRSTTSEGDVVAQLTPLGALTRFGPFPSLDVANWCHPRYYGGMTFLRDGRVAMSDYTYNTVDTGSCPVKGTPRDYTVTVFDPRIVPVISVETLVPTPRRRGARH